MTTVLPPRPTDATLSVTKAARLLGVHPNTVRAWSDAGRLRYYRINPRGDRRYRLGDLQRFLAAAESVPTDAHAHAPPRSTARSASIPPSSRRPSPPAAAMARDDADDGTAPRLIRSPRTAIAASSACSTTSPA